MKEDTNLIQKLEIKIPYKELKYGSKENYEQYLKLLLEDAKFVALREMYPFEIEFETIELPKIYDSWIVNAAFIISKWQNKQGVRNYSEGGLNWARDNDGVIPNQMLEQLPTKVGVPKKRERNDN